MKMKKLILIVLIFAAVVIVAGAIVVSNLEKNLNELTTMEIKDVDLSKVKDGTFTGYYQVLPVDAKVEVTVENHVIKNINLVEHGNGKGQAAEEIPQMVVEAQSLEVDSISGATYSSRVILKAIEKALIEGLN
ncbi:FMN-binding domain protein [anaerobic digester metagenome]